MSSVLEQLDRDDAVLLMYLGDELTPADRLRVDQRLRQDELLRARLESLQATQDAAQEMLERIDEMDPLPVKQQAVVRRTRRAMDQWQVDRLARRSEPALQRGLRYPWWSYPLAGAAAIIVAFVVWWNNIDSNAQYLPSQYAETFDASLYSPELVQFRQLEESIMELATVRSLEHEFDALEVLSQVN